MNGEGTEYYSGQTVEQLLARCGEKGVHWVLSGIDEAVEEKAESSLITACERMFRRLFFFDFEIKNGGFNQYFGNQQIAEEDHSSEDVAAFEFIGCSQCAQLLQRAIDLEKMKMNAANDEDAEQYYDKLSALDSEYYELCPNEVTEERLILP